MLSGAIAPGARLPATRTLARELGLSRTTVIDAFDRLVAEGLVDARVGSGSFASEVLNAERPRHPPQGTLPAAPAGAPRLAKAMAWAVDHFSDRPRLPHAPRAFITALPAFDAFPMAQCARRSPRICAPIAASPARQGRSSSPAARSRPFISSARCFSTPGDRVWFEN